MLSCGDSSDKKKEKENKREVPHSMDEVNAGTPRSTQDECQTPRSRNGRRERGPKSNRSSLACLACRSRKVRCDVMQQWPCANCLWHKKECVVRQHGNRRRSHLTTPNQSENTELVAIECQTGSSPAASSPEVEDLLQFLSAEGVNQEQDASEVPRMTVLSAVQSSEGTSPNSLDCMTRTLLPLFIKELPAHISADDFTFLKAKGAFALPPLKLQEALLQAYFEHVHPCLPIIDIGSFLESVTAAEVPENKLSLLLFQAVLAAGVVYVDLKLLIEAGFRSRKEAVDTLLNRAQLLYNLGYEVDRLMLVQVSLLMTLWTEAPDHHKSTWHWMDVAISQAFISELHLCSTSPKSRFTRKQRGLRHRIWWSCVIRDRLVSMGTKRPHGIRDDDHNVPMLQESDFEFSNGQGNPTASYAALCPYFHHRDKREQLAAICISLAHLCNRLKYSFGINQSVVPNGKPDGGGAGRLIPIDGASFAACHQDLMEWHDSLPINVKDNLISLDKITSSTDISIAMHRAVLHMIYHTVLLGLHRSRFVVLHSDPRASAFERELCRVFIQHSAKRVSDIERNVSECGLVNLLPPVAIASTGWAATVHLLESKGVLQENTERPKRLRFDDMEIIDINKSSTGIQFPQSVDIICPDTPVSDDTTSSPFEYNLTGITQNVPCMAPTECEKCFPERLGSRMPTPEAWSDVPMLQQFEEWLECSIDPINRENRATH